MKVPNISGSALPVALLLALWAGAAGAQTSPSYSGAVARAQTPQKTITRARQPVGPRHKASSFAPRPTKTRTFGAPIQAPILKHAPPKPRTPKD